MYPDHHEKQTLSLYTYIESPPLAPPTAPANVRDNSIGSTSISISWSPPTDSGGRTDLYYTVTYSNGSFVSPVLSVGTGTELTLTGLTPLTEYTISVTSVNGVSDQDSNTANRTTSIRVTTTNRGKKEKTRIRNQELINRVEDESRQVGQDREGRILLCVISCDTDGIAGELIKYD